MFVRGGNNSGEEQTLDSGYKSDHNTHSELGSARPAHCSCLIEGMKDHPCTSRSDCSGKLARHTPSSESPRAKAEFEDLLSPQMSIEAHSDTQEQQEPQQEAEVCETDSEDEISLDFNIPYVTPESFPVVPLPRTLRRAGYKTAARKVKKLHAKGKEKAQVQKKVDGSSAISRKSNTQSQPEKRGPLAEVIVPRQRAQFSFADAIEATEGLRLFSDGDGGESEDEYV